MFLGKPMMAIAATALCVCGGAATASAQQSGCANYYNQVMGAYQTMGPNSPQYNQMATDYSARCLSGAAAAPNPAYYQQPAPYGYAQPVAVDPAAALVGAAVVGSALAGALDDNRGYNDRGGYYQGRRW
ncbi:MAG: hypothetical protein WB697_20110 [Stellaceae bacterium]